MKPTLVILQIIFGSIFCMAQSRNATLLPPIPQKEPYPSKIEMINIGNDLVQFSAKLPPLRQLAGAPKAYYSYFWDFGDGTFSDVNLIDRDKPKHRYEKSGLYQVRLLATNNYAAGISPTVAQQFTIKVNTASKIKINTDFFSDNEKSRNVKIKVNRNPKPEEDLMAYIGYRNRSGANTAGSIVIFFNDQRFIHKSFGLTDKQTYNGESSSSLDRLVSNSADPEITGQVNIAENNHRLFNGAGNVFHPGSESETFFIPSSETRSRLTTLKKKYLDYTVFSYNNLQKDEEHFIFMNLQTLPDIIKDTNDNISMTAMIVPNDRTLQPELYQLTIQVLVSHDPNQMHLLQNRINYRFMGKKKQLTYKVEFQNIGKGAARNISLGIALPRQLNSASLIINEVSPALVSCDSIPGSGESCISTIKSTDSIFVVLKNIYLPGLEQNLVKNEDSTKGFIKYTIKFNKKPKKIPFSSRAVIKFDNNKPIYTNNATVRFIKGFSPGIVAGYNLSLANGDYSAKGPVQIGYILAPYAPSRPYFQIEAYLGLFQKEDLDDKLYIRDTNTLSDYRNLVPKNYQLDSAHIQTIVSKKRNLIQLVPLHFRYNVNDWFSVGIGVMGQIAISEKTTTVEKDRLYGKSYRYNTTTGTSNQIPLITPFDTLVTRSVDIKPTGNSKAFTEATFAPFLDLQFGRVRRTGPFLGLRYYRQLQGNVPNQFFVYAGFKL